MKKKHPQMQAASAPEVRTEPAGLIAQIVHAWRGLSLGAKLLVGILLAAHLPLILLALASIPQPFDVASPPYQHMGMISRIVDGLPLYTGPSSEHSVVTYAPLYWGIVAALAKVFGLTFTLARLVSIAAAFVVWFCVAGFVWTNTKRNLVLSVTAPTIVFLSSIMFGNWTMDINVNATHFAFVIAGFFALSGTLTNRRVALAALLLALGVLAKQTGLAYIAAAGFLVLMTSPKRLPLFLGVAGGFIAVSFFVLQNLTGGEFWNQTGPANASLPWYGARIYNEIILQSFLGYGGALLLFTMYALVRDWKPNVLLLARHAHYVMLAAGTGVACIAHPKYGSGNIHDVIALAGICICGCIGLHKLGERGGKFAPACRVAVPLLQTGLVLLLSLQRNSERWEAVWPTATDQAKYEQMAKYFKSGRAVLFGVPYIQRAYGQPSLGVPDDEFSKWKSGKLDYSTLPDLYMKPYRDEVFDYVIIADYFDPGHPVCRTIMQHYPFVVERIPPTPPGHNYLRHELVVLAPRRAAPQNAPPLR